MKDFSFASLGLNIEVKAVVNQEHTKRFSLLFFVRKNIDRTVY